MYCVYQIKSWNGKVYIGQTNDFKARMNSHKNSKEDTRIHNAIRRHGWDNFEASILEENLTAEQANEREIYWIAYNDSTNPRHGYNLQDGGQINSSHSEETKLKMSKNASGANNPMFGRIHSEESKIGMVQYGSKNGMFGKNHTEQSKRLMSKNNPMRDADKRKKNSESQLGMPQLSLHILIRLCLRAKWSKRKISKSFGRTEATIRKYENIENFI